MSGSVGASLHKEWMGDGYIGLSLGSCCLVAALEETSKKSTFKVTNQKPEGNCGTVVGAQEDSTSVIPSFNGSTDIPFSSAGWKGFGGATSQIWRHSSNTNGGAAEEMWNNKASGKQLSSQYKGVVAQPNGRWGAQIYEKHRRLWLGTFNNEEDAARSYDTAALKLRGPKAATNFVPIGDTHQEAIFLGRHSKSEIVEMLRTHTYHEELHHSNKMNGAECSNHDGPNPVGENRAIYPREHLFEKALTPSDVGKLNRLVVPKYHAHRCLPLEPETMQKGVILNCEDTAGKTWRFRYSYWSSSQSYVFTKGWSRYSKSNRLQSGDIVTLGRSTSGCRQLYISFRRRVSNQFPHQPAALGSRPVHPILVRLLPGYGESTHDSDSPPAAADRSIISKGIIPLLTQTNSSSSALDLYSLSSSMKSSPIKGNSWPVGYPQRKKVTSFSSNTSNVKVFGVNLSL
ncbi:hypothetical protein SUGI_0082750 [Cryptomeria japonica]|uniref:AP2/ERF and B3 domain-containing transcription factor RAV1 n=1 Tax=Cryptomeria japonica TaxID=3369 RepID=UPI002408E1CA|nr:AP2/ERF and B3 domain-containing transcription factor RAV1 [Cryptomeria japonica]GLJ08170.1 hypothetical protein SUGI_0082750 [Cryptomeria japonica]